MGEREYDYRAGKNITCSDVTDESYLSLEFKEV